MTDSSLRCYPFWAILHVFNSLESSNSIPNVIELTNISWRQFGHSDTPSFSAAVPVFFFHCSSCFNSPVLAFSPEPNTEILGFVPGKLRKGAQDYRQDESIFRVCNPK